MRHEEIPEIMRVQAFDVWKMENIIHYCNIYKKICTDVLEIMVEQIVIKNQAPDPSDPKAFFFMDAN